MQGQAFFDRFSGMAILSTVGTNLFPSVLLAQAALESGWASSHLSALHNNFFGIKDSASWKGQTVNMQTGEVINGKYGMVSANFRKYPSPLQSFQDRNRLIIDLPRYDPAEMATTPEGQAKLLQDGGYATDPNYANKLIHLIDRYDLKQYDRKKKAFLLIVSGIFLVGTGLVILLIMKIKSNN